MNDVEKLERWWRLGSPADSTASPPSRSSPRLLFIELYGWGHGMSKEWHEEFGIAMKCVDDFYLVPWEHLGHYRVVMVNTFGCWFDREGNLIPESVMFGGPELGRPGTVRRDTLISRLRTRHPEINIVVLNSSGRDDDRMYLDAGADYVFQLSCELACNRNFFTFLKGLLAGGHEARDLGG